LECNQTRYKRKRFINSEGSTTFSQKLVDFASDCSHSELLNTSFYMCIIDIAHILTITQVTAMTQVYDEVSDFISDTSDESERYFWHVEWNVVTSLELTHNAVMKVHDSSTSDKSKRRDQCRNPGFLQSTVTTSKRRLHQQRQYQRAHSNREQNLRCIPPTYNSKLPSLNNTW